MNMGTHPVKRTHPPQERARPDGFDRLVDHYDDQLAPLFTDHAYRVLSDLRESIEALRKEGLDRDGPALSQFALAWRNASRLLALAAIRRRPRGVLVH